MVVVAAAVEAAATGTAGKQAMGEDRACFPHTFLFRVLIFPHVSGGASLVNGFAVPEISKGKAPRCERPFGRKPAGVESRPGSPLS